MNIIDLQENLKDLPDKRLMQEMQRPTGSMPQFLVLSELQRRKRMRDDFKRQEAADMPTVAEEMITGAGVPQEGIMAMAGAMAPKTNVAQDTGLAQAMPMQATRAPQPQMMAGGGIVKMETGGFSNMTQYPFFRDNELAATYDLSNIASFIQRGYPREGLVANFGEDAVREAESMLLYKDDIGQIPLGTGDNFSKQRLRLMEQRTKEGFKGEKLPPNFGKKSYRDPLQSTYLGGERVNKNTDKAPTIDYTDPQSLQEIDPDSTTFIAPETVSEPRLNMDTAGGLGSMSLDSSVPEMALDTPLLLRQIIDSGVGIRGADTDPAQQLAEFLASRRSDLPGVNLPGESDPYIIDPDAAEKQGQAILDSLTAPPTGQQNNPNIDGPLSSALQYYGGTAFKGAATPEPTDEERRIIEGMSAVPEAGAKIQDSEQGASTLSGDNFSNDPTKGYSYPKDVPVDDPSMEGRAVLKRLSEGLGGGLPEEIYGGYTDPEAIKRRQQRERMLELEPLGEGMQKDVATTIAEAAEQKALEEQGSKTAAEAMRLQEESFDQPDPLSVLDSVTDGGAGGAGFGSAESEISKLLADRRKRADQNKWLALAEAGFAMMGPAATFGEGIGKGGKAGLAALRESQKGMDAFETDMLKLQASMNIADARNQTTLDAANIRSGATLKAALARLKGSAKNAPVGLVTAAASQVDDARTALQFARTDPEKLLAKNALDKAQATFEEIFNRVASQFPATSDMSTTTLSGRTQVG